MRLVDCSHVPARSIAKGMMKMATMILARLRRRILSIAPLRKQSAALEGSSATLKTLDLRGHSQLDDIQLGNIVKEKGKLQEVCLNLLVSVRCDMCSAVDSFDWETADRSRKRE